MTALTPEGLALINHSVLYVLIDHPVDDEEQTGVASAYVVDPPTVSDTDCYRPHTDEELATVVFDGKVTLSLETDIVGLPVGGTFDAVVLSGKTTFARFLDAMDALIVSGAETDTLREGESGKVLLDVLERLPGNFALVVG